MRNSRAKAIKKLARQMCPTEDKILSVERKDGTVMWKHIGPRGLARMIRRGVYARKGGE